jgi:hypothetical protein
MYWYVGCRDHVADSDRAVRDQNVTDVGLPEQLKVIGV